MPKVKEIVAGIAAISVVALPWYVMAASPRPPAADVITTAVVSLLVLLFSAANTTSTATGKGSKTSDRQSQPD